MTKAVLFLFTCLSFLSRVAAQDSDFWAENRESYYCAPAKENGKWGIKGDLTSKNWIVQPTYDTITLMECFNHKVPVGKYTYMRDADYLYVLYKKRPDSIPEDFSPQVSARNVAFDLAKMDGEVLNLHGYDGFSVAKGTVFFGSENAVSFDGIKLYKKDKCDLLEPTFVITEMPYSDITFLSGHHLYVGSLPGKQVLMNQRKQVIAEAKAFNDKIDTAKYDKYYGMHYYDYGYQFLPFLVVTNLNGKKQLYSTESKTFVTPELSKNANFKLVWSRFYEENYTQRYCFEYEDGGKKGVYQTGMKIGTSCKFDTVDFPGMFLEMTYLLGQFAGKPEMELYYLADTGRLLTTCTDVVEYMDEVLLVTKPNGKYTIYRKDKCSEDFDQLLDYEPADYSGFYPIKRNGLVGLTNGSSSIPAVFKDSVMFDSYYFDPIKHERVYFTQAEVTDGQERYYNTAGKRCVSRGKFGIRQFDNKLFGLVEYHQNDSSRFETAITPTYLEMIAMDRYYAAKNQQKKWGMLSDQGDTVIPFAYDAITAVPYEYDFWKYGLFFAVRTGDQNALYSLRDGIIIPAAEQSFKMIRVNTEFLVEVIRGEGKKQHRGYYSLKGIPALPVIFPADTTRIINDDTYNLFSVEEDLVTYSVSLSRMRGYNQSYMAFDFVWYQLGYRINCESNRVELFDMVTQQLVAELDMLEFAKNMGYHLVMKDGKYILSTYDDTEDRTVETTLESISFYVFEDQLQLLGKKGKSWYSYLPQEGAEKLFIKTLVDSKYLRVTVRE